MKKKIQLTSPEEKRLSQCERIYQLLKKNKKLNRWTSVMDMYLVSWSLAISTKISEIRRHEMVTINNRLEKQPNWITYSSYKLA
jgi:hypothetical protein